MRMVESVVISVLLSGLAAAAAFVATFPTQGDDLARLDTLPDWTARARARTARAEGRRENVWRGDLPAPSVAGVAALDAA